MGVARIAARSSRCPDERSQDTPPSAVAAETPVVSPLIRLGLGYRFQASNDAYRSPTPSRIWERNSPRIMDFGVSRIMASRSQTASADSHKHICPKLQLRWTI